MFERTAGQQGGGSDSPPPPPPCVAARGDWQGTQAETLTQTEASGAWSRLALQDTTASPFVSEISFLLFSSFGAPCQFFLKSIEIIIRISKKFYKIERHRIIKTPEKTCLAWARSCGLFDRSIWSRGLRVQGNKVKVPETLGKTTASNNQGTTTRFGAKKGTDED